MSSKRRRNCAVALSVNRPGRSGGEINRGIVGAAAVPVNGEPALRCHLIRSGQLGQVVPLTQTFGVVVEPVGELQHVVFIGQIVHGQVVHEIAGRYV